MKECNCPPCDLEYHGYVPRNRAPVPQCQCEDCEFAGVVCNNPPQDIED